jgi:hypothetical protein
MEVAAQRRGQAAVTGAGAVQQAPGPGPDVGTADAAAVQAVVAMEAGALRLLPLPRRHV